MKFTFTRFNRNIYIKMWRVIELNKKRTKKNEKCYNVITGSGQGFLCFSFYIVWKNFFIYINLFFFHFIFFGFDITKNICKSDRTAEFISKNVNYNKNEKQLKLEYVRLKARHIKMKYWKSTIFRNWNAGSLVESMRKSTNWSRKSI